MENEEGTIIRTKAISGISAGIAAGANFAFTE